MIVVTGGSGLAGRAVVRDLVEHGYDVTSIDMAPQPPGQGVRFSRADLTDYGQAIAALSAIDERVSKVTGIVHLAAIPAPGLAPNHVIFETNMVSTYNVFEAARVLGIRNVVWASSETVLGIPFDTPPPYVPVDEEYRGRPETAYSLSKFLSEEMAKERRSAMPSSPPSTPTSRRGSGISGLISTYATRRSRAGWRSNRR
jgi:nucleoside-diphosphate-sugar epimerase